MINDLENNRWDDLVRFSLVLNQVSGRITHDFINGGVLYASNARYPDEPASMVLQMPHAWLEESEIRPHIHWAQQGASIPNWLLAYKIMDNGGAGSIDVDYSNHTLSVWSSHAFTYTSGIIHQITKFPAIDMTGYGLSDMVHFVLFRDYNNDSTLFGGVDPSAIDELVYFFDPHGRFDSRGSRQEYLK